MNNEKRAVKQNVKHAKIIGIRFNETEIKRLSDDMKKARSRNMSSFIKKKIFQGKTRRTLVLEKLNTICQRAEFLMNIADTTWKTEQNWLKTSEGNQNFKEIFKSFKDAEFDALLEIQEKQKLILSELKVLNAEKTK